MCLAVPLKVLKIKGKKAKVGKVGHFHWIDISLIREKLNKGDYLLSYQGVAIERISPKEGRKILDLLDQVEE